MARQKIFFSLEKYLSTTHSIRTQKPVYDQIYFQKKVYSLQRNIFIFRETFSYFSEDLNISFETKTY